MRTLAQRSYLLWKGWPMSKTTCGPARPSTPRWLALLYGAACIAAAHALSAPAAALGDVWEAPAKYRANRPVLPGPDGALYCEAEEFAVLRPGWQPRRWGDNYYAATFANCFLSRKAFLAAPEDGPETAASITVQVSQPGRYLVLVRYEAPYRFHAQFRVQVEQAGKVRLDRLYGAREHLKIWPFGKRLQTEVAWPWGATENIVWEGHDAWAELEPGPAKITLLARQQPAPAARRHVDLVMLTRDAADVQQRIEKENYLPLDGLLTQGGDVWARLVNLPDGSPMKLVIPPGTEHSPYWVHLRRWKPIELSATPGQASEWTEVGSLLDSLNDGQWNLRADPAQPGQPLHYRVEFGAPASSGAIQKIAEFESRQARLPLAYHADTRYYPHVGTQEQVLYELLAHLKRQPMHGKTPTLTPIYGYTFDPGLGPAYDAAVEEFRNLFALRSTRPDPSPGARASYVDWRGQSPEQLEQTCRKLSDAQRQAIEVVSLGDEITLPAPTGREATEGFVAFLKAQGLPAEEVDPASGGDWSKIAYSPAPELRHSKPALFYWSQRYRHQYGIETMKRHTAVLRQWLPHAGIGANFSPQHGHAGRFYLGEVFQWVHCFRQEGLTLPWSEDYVWCVPIGTPQMNGLCLDLFRAGLRHKPGGKILYYVMPHAPGNTPAAWRRMFHQALGHGTKIVNLFEFRPVQAAYTENHVSDPAMYAMVLRSFRELGQYEDIVQAGQRQPANVGLWFSETSDIWDDTAGSFGAAKRALYVAILHHQLPVDVLVDQDALDGTLDQYKVLYLADQHVSRMASARIAAWVERGGRLFATAAAGMFDEYHRPNSVLRSLMGVDAPRLIAPDKVQVHLIKQDLPFVPAIETASWGDARLPAFGAITRVAAHPDAVVEATFSDGSPAVVTRKAGQGETRYCAFLPGLTYFRPAIPQRPLDRGARDDSMGQLLPREFEQAAGRLIGSLAQNLPRPVRCSQPLVEANFLRSPSGSVIVLINWSGKPISGLRVSIHTPFPWQHASTASGGKVSVFRQPERTELVLDLDVADVLVLR